MVRSPDVPLRRGTILVLVGFVLLVNPLFVAHYDLNDPDRYRYEATTVSFHENGTYTTGGEIARRLDSEVACLGTDAAMRRTCMLERAVHANGGVVYDGLSEMFLTADYAYVFVWGSGFFEPTATELENGSVRYGLTRTPTKQALERVVTPMSKAAPGVRTAIRNGAYETHDKLDSAGELVRSNGELYVVYAASFHSTHRERDSTVMALQWVLGILGTALVLHGQRRRIE